MFNNCIECDSGKILSKDSECLCKLGYLNSDFICEPCHQVCKFCRGPNLKNCLCMHDGNLEECKCAQDEFWYGTCQKWVKVDFSYPTFWEPRLQFKIDIFLKSKNAFRISK